MFTVNCIEKDENKEKEAVNGPFKKPISEISIVFRVGNSQGLHTIT